MKNQETYRSELCVPCELCQCDTLEDVGKLLVDLGEYMHVMSEAGVVIGDHERLGIGKLVFETNEPSAAKFVEIFPACSDDDHYDRGHQLD